jgi:hypothetical protein
MPAIAIRQEGSGMAERGLTQCYTGDHRVLVSVETRPGPKPAIWHYSGFISSIQLGHMRPPDPADLMVFDHRETEEEAPVASPSQVAKVLVEV